MLFWIEKTEFIDRRSERHERVRGTPRAKVLRQELAWHFEVHMETNETNWERERREKVRI